MTMLNACVGRTRTLLLAAGAFVLPFLADTALAKDVVVRFATLQSPQHELSVEMNKAFERIKQETEGRVSFQVFYGNGSGFAAKQYVSALEFGMLDGGLIATSASALEYPWLGVYGIPFLAPDIHARQPMLEATRPMLEEFSRDHKIVPLAYPLHLDKWLVIYSNKDIQSLADFKGMLIRTYDPNTNAIVTAVGAVPASIQKSEIYMALQRRTIDGAITGITAAKEMKLDEVIGNVVQLDVMFLPHILGLNQKVWDEIDAKDQEIVRKVFAAWEQDFSKLGTDPALSGDPYAYAAGHGMKVIVPGDDIQQVFQKIHEQAVAEFVAKDKKAAKAYEAIKAARSALSN